MKPLQTLAFMVCLVLLSSNSCKKDGTKNCWQAVEYSGAIVQGLAVCDKTKAEAEAAYPGYLFFDTNEPVYCWRLQRLGTTSYSRSIPQSIADQLYPQMGFTYSRMDCNSFCIWKMMEKSKSKITNQYLPNKLITETYTTDTCGKISVGKIVVVRETADSLITREYLQQY